MVADSKFFAIFATLVLVWIPIVRGDSSDLKCYDSDGWKTLGSQKEVSCPNGTCLGFWTAEPGKDEKKGVLMCQPSSEIRNKFTTSDREEYINKKDSMNKNQKTFFGDLLTNTDKISASGSLNGYPIPGININGNGTGFIKDIMYGQLSAGDPFSEKRKVKLEIDANVGAVEFQVKVDQEVQFDRDSQRGDIKINEKHFDVEKVCIGQPQVCTGGGRRGLGDLEAFEKAVLKDFGSNKEVTLTWGNVINIRVSGNFKDLVEKYQKVRKAITENPRVNYTHDRKALKNAIEKIIGDITLEAKGNVEIDDSTSAEVNINVNSNEILNQIYGSPERVEPTFAYKICTEKKCLHQGECTKNLCNHPDDLVKMANSAEGVKLSIVFMALNLLFLTKLY